MNAGPRPLSFGMTVPQPPAIVLLSGGLDSATVLAIAQAEGYSIHALSFTYGQRHANEVDAARRIAAAAGVASHRVFPLPLDRIGGSALTGAGTVPLDRSPAEIGEGIPSTYVPARNTIFLALALACCEVLGAENIFIGVNALDYSGYPDCRPEFLEAFEALARAGTRSGAAHKPVRVHAPLLRLTKAQIIRRGSELGVDYAATRSCYSPDPAGMACGRCDACLLRLRGFEEAGLIDPAPYQDRARA